MKIIPEARFEYLRLKWKGFDNPSIYLFFYTGSNYIIAEEDLSNFYILTSNFQEFISYIKKKNPSIELEDAWVEDREGKRVNYSLIHI